MKDTYAGSIKNSGGQEVKSLFNAGASGKPTKKTGKDLRSGK